MMSTRLQLGQILIVFAIVILGIWLATQWVATMLGYQTALGPAWFQLGAFLIYRPWSLFVWWYRYDAYAPSCSTRPACWQRRADFSAALQRSAAPYGARANRARHDLWIGALGRAQGVEPRNCFRRAGSFWDASRAPICATTAPSMSWHSHRLAAGRASACRADPA
jgi:type IV secretion system protein VirD4